MQESGSRPGCTNKYPGRTNQNLALNAMLGARLGWAGLGWIGLG